MSVQERARNREHVDRRETIKNQTQVIKGLIEYAKNPKYSQEGENYLSDGQMLDIILEQLEKLIE